MMRGALERQESSADGFADGIRAWIRGDETLDAEAAGLLVGEIGIRWLKVLRSKFEKG
jgi:hypothetical protein